MSDYRIVWPNGQLIDQGPESMMIERFFIICNQLKAWSIPQEYLPRYEPVPEQVPQHPAARHRQQVWEPNPYQIERVRSRAWGWNDPCVICGGKFPQCHDPYETESFVNRVKDWLRVNPQ
jgi:hypothetical protein